MARYEGRTKDTYSYRVLKDGLDVLPRRLTMHDSPPSGFSWGHMGAGSLHLAMTLLIEEGLSHEEARSVHVDFCRVFIAMLDSNEDWTFTSNDLTLQIRAVQRHFGKDESSESR